MVPSHLTYYQRYLWHKHQNNFAITACGFNPKFLFKDYTFKITSTSLRRQWINKQMWEWKSSLAESQILAVSGQCCRWPVERDWSGVRLTNAVSTHDRTLAQFWRQVDMRVTFVKLLTRDIDCGDIVRIYLWYWKCLWVFGISCSDVIMNRTCTMTAPLLPVFFSVLAQFWSIEILYFYMDIVTGLFYVSWF